MASALPFAEADRSAVVDADCIKLTSYFGERDRVDGRLTAGALIDLYAGQGLAASILLHGMAAIAVDTRPNIETVLDQALELTNHGLVTLERARLLSDEIDLAGIVSRAGEATRLTFFLGSHDHVYGAPAFEVICELLYRRGVAGATVLPGMDGTAHGRRQRAPFFSRNAEVPMMIIVVDSDGLLGPVLPELDGLVRRPLLTLEQVRVCKRDGRLISHPEEARGNDDHGFPLWQKLTVYTSETARYAGQPIHRAIVRELRSAGISSATSHRGIWGFHGDQPPHGGHFLQPGRHVPVVTTVIDTADRTLAAFGIVDKLTSERGLVTSEIIPAFCAASAHCPRPR
jgi:PII-like signaling protein